VDARILPAPYIQYNQSIELLQPKFGVWNLRDKRVSFLSEKDMPKQAIIMFITELVVHTGLVSQKI
jgi:hypothetical protein